MKISFKALLCFMLAFISINTYAQRIKLEEGDLSALQGQTTISIEFTYDNMSVGKFANEADYIAKKKTEYNTKEPGRGDNWEKSWVNDRKMVFEPKFIDLFEKSTNITVKAGAKYTMIFHTTTTEPGFNAYAVRKNAEIDAEVTIVETADRSKKIAVISLKNAPGRTFMGNDYATGDRIAECYAVAGKKLGKFIKK